MSGSGMILRTGTSSALDVDESKLAGARKVCLTGKVRPFSHETDSAVSRQG
jgi:hypothetical protein